MPNIRPFRAVRFNLTRAGNPTDLVAPPLDPADQLVSARFRERSPFNVAHLLSQSSLLDEGEAEERYGDARDRFRHWLDEGLLQRDSEPALYVCELSHSGPLGRRTLRGFLGLLKLEAPGRGILLPHPHRVFSTWLNLREVVQADLSAVMVLYEDPDGTVDELLRSARSAFPDLAVCDDNDVEHRLFPIHSAHEIRQVVGHVDRSSLLIGHGQELYEAALAHRTRSAAASGSTAANPLDYVLAFFANSADPALAVRPFHRAFRNLRDFEFPRFLRSLPPLFELEQVPSLRDLSGITERLQEAGLAGSGFAIVAGGAVGRRTGHIAHLVPERLGARLNAVSDVQAVRELDVTVLNEVIIKDRVGITVAPDRALDGVDYVVDAEEAMALGRSKETQLVVMLNPTTATKVRELCEAGGRLPFATADFYPKVPLGLVFNDLESF